MEYSWDVFVYAQILHGSKIEQACEALLQFWGNSNGSSDGYANEMVAFLEF